MIAIARLYLVSSFFFDLSIEYRKLTLDVAGTGTLHSESYDSFYTR